MDQANLATVGLFVPKLNLLDVDCQENAERNFPCDVHFPHIVIPNCLSGEESAFRDAYFADRSRRLYFPYTAIDSSTWKLEVQPCPVLFAQRPSRP